MVESWYDKQQAELAANSKTSSLEDDLADGATPLKEVQAYASIAEQAAALTIELRERRAKQAAVDATKLADVDGRIRPREVVLPTVPTTVPPTVLPTVPPTVSSSAKPSKLSSSATGFLPLSKSPAGLTALLVKASVTVESARLSLRIFLLDLQMRYFLVPPGARRVVRNGFVVGFVCGFASVVLSAPESRPPLTVISALHGAQLWATNALLLAWAVLKLFIARAILALTRPIP